MLLALALLLSTPLDAPAPSSPGDEIAPIVPPPTSESSSPPGDAAPNPPPIAAPDDATPPVIAPPPPPPAPPPAPPPEVKKPVVDSPIWDDAPEELARAAEGTIGACEVMTLPVELVPGVGDLIGTVAEWACLAPAAIAVDTVAVHFAGRDGHLWQAGLAVLVQKLFEDLIDVPFNVALAAAVVLAVGTLVGTVLVATFAIPGFPVFVPTLVAITVGAFLIAPVAFLKQKGGDWLFDAVLLGLSKPVAGEALAKARSETLLQPHDAGWTRPFVLMAAAAGADADGDARALIPIAGPLFKADAEMAVTKERMRRVGRDMLGDDVSKRDLSAMDGTIDAIAITKGVTGAVGEGIIVAGAGVGIVGALLPPLKVTDQKTGDTIGFIGLGTALVGLGVYALSSTLDTAKTCAVPLAYGAFE